MPLGRSTASSSPCSGSTLSTSLWTGTTTERSMSAAVDVGETDELPVAPVEVFAGERQQTARAEVLDHERAHDAAVDDGAAQPRRRRIARARQLAHESTREAVARAGRIGHFLERKRRHGE